MATRRSTEIKRLARIEAERVREQQITRNMATDPNSWPQWPVLPLKNRKEPGVLGYMTESKNNPFRVYLGLIFGGAKPTGVRNYKTVDELLDAGWVVD